MGRKFVPQSTIDRRVARKDARMQGAARQLGLASEAWPYASVEIVRADTPIDAAAFHEFLADPATGPKLDAMLADNARIDAQLREDDRLEDLRESNGSTCGANCGWCGRCS